MFGHAAVRIIGTSGNPAPAHNALVDDPAGILAILLAVLAVIFWLAGRRATARFFKIVPALLFCYFVPTTLTTLGVIPDESALYDWVKSIVLPAALMLLILALDVPGIIRLGPKAVIMLLSGTAGVVVGGPIALLICQRWLPEDAWRGMAALSGSWIGGGANFVAIGQQAGASDAMIALMVIPDVIVANIWMGFLLFCASRERQIDAMTGANAEAIRDLERRLTDFQERVSRIPALSDLMAILAIGFVASWASYRLGMVMPEIETDVTGTLIGHSTWKYIFVTTLGVSFSFTRVRKLEGAGASKVGSVMIYLLVACIGAHANFRMIVDAPAFLVMGFIWMSVHVIFLLGVGKLIRAPIFFVAVGSQANIGGAASAPVVAAAFHPSLAAVGALLAVAGYVLGTYCGLICMHLLKLVAGAN
jgi:uncharacterized membrane protein